MDETTAKKAAEDVAAYARTLASRRHRNATLAASAVMESRAFTEEEALGASPPLIDFVAADIPELLDYRQRSPRARPGQGRLLRDHALHSARACSAITERRRAPSSACTPPAPTIELRRP